MNTRIEKRYQKRQAQHRIIIIALLILTLIGLIYFKCAKQIKPSQQLNVPIENQLPDLPNGCEVTSLSMLLNYYQIKTSKDELAQKIKHVSSYTANGKRGNPNEGFVGYMSQKNAGWCVYNEPLYNVAKKYTNRIQNATGSNFEQIIKLVSDGHPVLIITNLTFAPVNDMQTWDTEQGKVQVTPSSHACVITGYNLKKKIVYVNNPYGIKNQAVSWDKLAKSYDQRGKQALYLN